MLFGPSVFLRRKLLLGLTAGLAIGSAGGCHREFYRNQADNDARALVEEKSCDPRWALPGFNIEMNPASRYYDGEYDPVKPPMPPDDPESHELMHCVYGKKGWAKWHQYGDRPGLENPTWQQCLDQYVARSSDGTYVLKLEDSVRLAYIHSPTYQQQLETLYLSAIDVSTERFRLQTQFYGGNATTYNSRGNLGGTAARGVNNTTQGGTQGVPYGGGTGGAANLFRVDPKHPLPNDTLNSTTGFQANRRFATAGELVVGFANSFVWQFAGPNQNATASIASFSFLQPLLKAGGRVIGLEQLTLAERQLLGNVRAMYRYRQGFYTLVVIGDAQNVTGPQRIGGLQSGTGLAGFSGQGTTGLGGVGDATGFGNSGANAGTGAGGGGGAAGAITGFSGGGEGQVAGGFVALLQQLQQIRNTKALLNAEHRTLDLLKANFAAGLIDIGQVDQFKQSIETERANYLQARNTLDVALDAFKAGILGLPPHLPIELDDSMIQPFQFIGAEIVTLQDGLAKIASALGDLNEKPTVAEVEAIADRIAAARRDIEEQLGVVLGDLQKLDSVAASRFTEVTPEEQQTTREEWAKLKETHKQLIEAHAETGRTLSEIRVRLVPASIAKVPQELVALSVQMGNIVNELSLVQARSRLDVITVEPLQLHPLDALAIARANRVDWMNRRAQLVNTWRLIEFNANALEAGLDLVFSGDMGTTGDNPLNFTHTTGGLRAGLRFDAPFTRLLERNNYRQQLIQYQQVRRSLIQFEDTTHRVMRNYLRQMNRYRVNLEIQRRAVAIAIRRVDQRRENLNKPAPAVAAGAAQAQFGPTAALDLLTALSDLRSAQNNFMSVWLNYYEAHMQLIRDLGVMQLDENGLWVPPQPLDQYERLGPDECLLPPEIPAQWFKDLDGAGVTGGSSEATTIPALPPPPAPRDPALGPDAAFAPKKPELREESRWWPLRRKEPVPPRTLSVRAVSAAREVPEGKDRNGK